MRKTTTTSKASLQTVTEGWELRLVLDPVPAARPRVGAYGTYYPKNYSRYMIMADEALHPLSHGAPTTERCYMSVVAVCAKPKSGKLLDPRGDVDNYAKAILDSITKAQIIYSDDKQVKFLGISKRYALPGEAPHYAVRVGLTLGVVWLMEPHLETPSEDIFDVYDREDLSEFM